MNQGLRRGEPDDVGMSAARVANIRRLGGEWVAQGKVASLTTLIARRGAIVLHEAYGRLGPEPDAPPLPLDAIYPIASITKPILAAMVMQLVEDGRLGLNRPVQEYVPEFTGDGKEAVMVHHLLTHTSGLTPEGIAAHGHAKIERGEWAFDGPPWAVGMTIAPQLYDAPLTRPPGQGMTYGNLNYGLLADIVGRLSGRPIAEVAAERVFEPLGMADTSFVGLDPTRAGTYVRRADDDAYAGLNNPVRPRMLGGASANSTALDMARFGQAFLDGGRPILSPASVAAMTRDQIPGVGAVYGAERFGQAGWGLGWGMQLEKKAVNHPSLLSPRAFGHSGAGGPALFVDPEHEMVLVYFLVELAAQRGGIKQWTFDLFANAAIGAIED